MKFNSFETISCIDVSRPESWQPLFISFDIDWADDEVLNDSIELMSSYPAKATWFATHSTKLLEKIQKNEAWELGLHPNFNRLLEGQGGDSAESIVRNLLSIVPGARSIRSHSLVQSSRLAQIFLNVGITHDSNDYIPGYSGIEVKPFVLENNLVKAPYIFSDELWCVKDYGHEKFESLIYRPGLRIFDFHPIHIFLNTESLDRYERTRPLHRQPKELIKHRFEGYGTRNRLIELLKSKGRS